MADSLSALSEGQIKTGVYHADVLEPHKETLHRQWREGRVKVVCATIGKQITFWPDVRGCLIPCSVRFGHRQGRRAVCYSSHGEIEFLDLPDVVCPDKVGLALGM